MEYHVLSEHQVQTCETQEIQSDGTFPRNLNSAPLEQYPDVPCKHAHALPLHCTEQELPTPALHSNTGAGMTLKIDADIAE